MYAIAILRYRKPLEEVAMHIIASSPEQFTAMIKSGFDVYAKAIKAAGVKPDYSIYQFSEM